MSFDFTSLKMINIKFNHFFLSTISRIYLSLFQVLVDFLEIRCIFSILNIKTMTIKFNTSFLNMLLVFCVNASYCYFEFISSNFKSSCIFNLNFLVIQELFNQYKVLFSYIFPEISCNSTIRWIS